MKKKLSLFLAVLIVVLTVLTALPTAAANSDNLADSGADVSQLADSGLSAPTITKIENRSNGIYLQWSNVGAYQYAVEVYSNDYETTTYTTSCSLLYTNVKVGTTYTFIVYGVDKNKDPITDTDDGFNNSITYTKSTQPTVAPTTKPTTAPNPTVAPTTKPTTAPKPTKLSTPMITGFDSVDSGVKITWGKVSGAEIYRVYYKSSDGWTKIGETSSNTFVHPNVSSGATFTYTVRCMNAKMTEFTSDFYSAGWTYTYNMDTPQITKLESLTSGVKITWNKVPNATKYRVYYKNSNGNWVKMTTTAATSYLDTDVRKGTAYTYTVRCISADESHFTSAYNNSGWRYVYSPVPLGESAIYTSGDTDLDGQVTVMDATMIQYVLANLKTDTYNAVATLGNVNPSDGFDISDATFIMRKVASVAIPSTVTVGTKNVTLALPESSTYSAPAVTAASAADGIKLTWNKVSGTPLYRVFQKSGGKWYHLADTTALSYTDTNVKGGSSYSYAVRCVTADHQKHLSPFSSLLTHTYSPSVAPTQPATQAPTVKPADPTPTATVTPTVHVYDGKISVSWNAVTGATKYVVKTYFASQGINNPFDTKTVTTTSTTMNHVFTKKANQSYYGETFLTAVIAYKNNTAVTTAKPVSTTTVQKAISRRGNERIRTIFTVNRDINFCNVCGKWMKNAYQTNLMGKISPDEACMSHQPYHKGADGCGAGSYRCWKVQWPSGLMNYEQSDNANYHQYWSIVDTNWAYDYYPTVTTAPSISSIQKVSYTKEIHPQQLDNTISASDRTDSAPLMQADGALEISFKPVDNNIKIYDIWVKTTDAKSVNKLTQIPTEGDKYNNVPRYNGFDGRWTYDEKYNDWAVIGYVLVTDSGYESYCYFTDTRTGSFCNKTVTTSNLSTLVYTLPNWYGNEYNSCYDWNMLDNNTKYEFAIQPRLDRERENKYYSDTVPAAPKGQSKSYTWTGRDYEYYTENNAYFQGASFRNSGIKTKSLELYAEQRNLNWKTWGNFWLYQIGHDDRTGKDYITENTTMPLVNGYRIPARTNFEHNGGIYEWKGYNQDGNYALATRATAIKHSNTHKEGNTATFTIASHGVYARTSLYDIWSKRNNYGKHITLIDHSIPYYDPLCYEFTIDGQYRYYYEDINDAWVKQRPSNYTPAVPDSKATRKSTNEHLYESEIRPDLYKK